MSAVVSAPCEFLPWDTDFFKIRIGRIKKNTLVDDEAIATDSWSKNERIRCLYFLARPDDPPTLRTAEKNRFQFIDVRLTLDRSLTSKEPLISEKRASTLRVARPDDIPALQIIARKAHREARFFSDVNFHRERAEDFYATWIALECQGRAQQVLVAASQRDLPVGYISCHFDVNKRQGQIGLVGVSEEFRQQGLGGNLVDGALDWLAQQGAEMVSVVTQGRNVSATRLYERRGFVTRELQFWYHKWYPKAQSQNT